MGDVDDTANFTILTFTAQQMFSGKKYFIGLNPKSSNDERDKYCRINDYMNICRYQSQYSNNKVNGTR